MQAHAPPPPALKAPPASAQVPLPCRLPPLPRRSIFPRLVFCSFPDRPSIVQTPRQYEQADQGRGAGCHAWLGLWGRQGCCVLVGSCEQAAQRCGEPAVCLALTVWLACVAGSPDCPACKPSSWLHTSPPRPSSRAEELQARLAAEAGAEVERAEAARCRQWLQHGKRGGMSHRACGAGGGVGVPVWAMTGDRA